MTHVAVLMGGTSSEREVSLNSGKACAAALAEKGFEVTQVDVGPSIVADLQRLKPDVAFNALHGPVGEDGKIQGLLEFLRIPYTHSGVLASALAMNKVKAKDVMRAAGIPVPEGRVVGRAEVAAGHVLPLPYVLKPIAEGSSFGVVIVRDENAPHELSQQDWTFGEEILAERYTAGLELTCAVLGDRALDIIEIRPTGGRQDGGQGGDDASAGGFYDYHAKYAQGGSVHILPAQIDADVYARIRQWSLDTHRAIGCRGITRTDFRYDPQTGEVVALEINTQPGMTATSLAPEMAAHAGLTFGDLVEWLVKDASLER